MGLPHIPDSSLWCLSVKATVGKNPPTNLIISHLTFLWRCIQVPMLYAPKSLHKDCCVYYIKCSVTIFEAFLCLCNKSVETTDEKRIWQSAWFQVALIWLSFHWIVRWLNSCIVCTYVAFWTSMGDDFLEWLAALCTIVQLFFLGGSVVRV